VINKINFFYKKPDSYRLTQSELHKDSMLVPKIK